jgi:hypothetical protein
MGAGAGAGGGVAGGGFALARGSTLAGRGVPGCSRKELNGWLGGGVAGAGTWLSSGAGAWKTDVVVPFSATGPLSVVLALGADIVPEAAPCDCQ